MHSHYAWQYNEPEALMCLLFVFFSYILFCFTFLNRIFKAFLFLKHMIFHNMKCSSSSISNNTYFKTSASSSASQILSLDLLLYLLSIRPWTRSSKYATQGPEAAKTSENLFYYFHMFSISQVHCIHMIQTIYKKTSFHFFWDTGMYQAYCLQTGT